MYSKKVKILTCLLRKKNNFGACVTSKVFPHLSTDLSLQKYKSAAFST